tara:strand:- start:42 stop:1268 length:1227 start_codon:yes stop_codon:yes gene_type:complete
MANLYDTPYFKDYNIVNQANVERGINALQANQGIVNTLTGLPIGPASGRAYLRNLSGSEEPITEDFFNADQLAEIKNRTASSMAEASMDPSSFDALNKRVLYDLEKPISMSGIFSNPATDIDATLGMYTYKQNPDGTISAIDTHDFDSIEGGGQQFYDQKKKGVGTPDYQGIRGLPFLEPWAIPEDPGFYIQDDEMYGPANKYDTYPGGRFVPGEPGYSLTQEEDIFAPKEDTMKDVFDAYQSGDITGSKLARIIGGIYGHSGTDMSPDEENIIAESGDYLMRNNPNWTRSGIPVNINMGRISHRDKLKANPNFARYIADTGTIPSQIRQEAQKFAPRRIAPRHSPHGGGPGTGGGDYHSGQTSTVDGQTTDWGDMSHMIAGGGLAQHAPIRPYSLGGLAYLLYGGLV